MSIGLAGTSNAYHFEIQKTFLTEKAENALVIETLSMATGFKIAKKYDVRTLIEIYMPAPEIKQSVVRMSYIQEWSEGPAFWEIPIKNEVDEKMAEVTTEIFDNLMPEVNRLAPKVSP